MDGRVPVAENVPPIEAFMTSYCDLRRKSLLQFLIGCGNFFS